MSRVNDGFSLLEVLVAIVIVSAVGLSAVGLSLQLAHDSDQARTYATASALAQWTLDQAVTEQSGPVPLTAYAPPFDHFRHALIVQRGQSLTHYTAKVEWEHGALALDRAVTDTLESMQ